MPSFIFYQHAAKCGTIHFMKIVKTFISEPIGRAHWKSLGSLIIKHPSTTLATGANTVHNKLVFIQWLTVPLSLSAILSIVPRYNNIISSATNAIIVATSRVEIDTCIARVRRQVAPS